MSNTIKIRRSAVPGAIPTTTALPLGELALNTNDGLMFMHKLNGGVDSIVTIGASSGTLGIAGGGTSSTTASGALTALGAYPSSNPSGFTNNTGTVTSVGGTGTVSGLTLTGAVTGSGSLTLGGAIGTLNQNTSGSSASCTGNAATASNMPYSGLTGTVPTWNQNTSGSSASCTGNSLTSSSTSGSSTSCSGTSYLASAVSFLPNRTDTAAYQVLWGAPYTSGSGTIAYSCSAVTITSSSGQLNVGSLVSAGNVTAYSDESVKTNWRSYSTDFVDQLAKVKSGTFDRTDQVLTQDGCSAQSLMPLLPNSVIADTQGKLSVNYGNASMVSAIEIAKRVLVQDQKINALEIMIQTLVSQLRTS